MAERYLLFDAGCLTCSKLARNIEHTTDGWIIARSLREPAVQTLLDGARPGWHWEPALLEVDGEHARAYTGAALRVKLLLGVGPRRTWRVAQLIRRAGVPLLRPAQVAEGETRIGRRRLLGQGAALFAGVALLGKFSPQIVAVATTQGSTPTVTPVAPTDPAIKQLQQSQTAQAAAQHFGAPNWQAVQKARNADRTVYLIPYTGQGQSTYLVAGDPAAGEQNIGVVLQLAPEGQRALAITWHTPDGQPLGSTVLRAGQAAQIVHPSTIRPDFNVGCFIECIGQSVGENCLEFCIGCAFEPAFNPECVVCVACAGINAFPCIN